MSFIRDKKEELTGYQEIVPYNESIDLECDFVMVYGNDATLLERIKEFKEKGYVVHLMTGIAWGDYKDYLYGEWDGREHWDEGQVTRKGDVVSHGIDTPYMVPTISFANYMVERLKIAVDSGVEAIHLEEPEFWDFSGYSEAFKREYLLYYKEEWKAPHTSLDNHYKAAKLKAYLYARAIERISAELKEYALIKYNKVIRIYVPTHSLLNYTQWKIMSPEGQLTAIHSIDGYIAQVWTGTSRTPNMYEGKLKERTFETAYLEYGIMQELVRNTGRDMWFLHDPIEDNPRYDWADYQKNYLETVVASLLHPYIHKYEICPWPNRVFRGVYPVDDRDKLTAIGSNSKPIPSDYASILSGLIQTLGNMNQSEIAFENSNPAIGVLMSDSGMFQRSFPDQITQTDTQKQMNKETFDFIESEAFPNFYGMTLPLLKYGLPVAPVQLDNVKHFAGYLDKYQYLILSYEYIKPESPDINNILASWVKGGGTLIYIGDGSDPYHNIQAWWNTGDNNYPTPAIHLFEMLGLPQEKEGIYAIGKGRVQMIEDIPASFCISEEKADSYRQLIKDILKEDNFAWNYSNHLTLHRGPYIISAVMDESCIEEPKRFTGLYTDMFSPDFEVLEEKIILPGENCLLFDYSTIEEEEVYIVGTSGRVYEMMVEEELNVTLKSAADILTRLRLRLPRPLKEAVAVGDDGEVVELDYEWDETTKTALFTYMSVGKKVKITGNFE